MNTFRIILIFSSIFFSSFAFPCFADGEEEPIPLVISNTGNGNSGYKSPARPCVYCIIQEENNQIVFVFLFEIGRVSILVSEDSLGASWSANADSSAGIVPLEVTLSPGMYHIKVTQSDGVEYDGVFEV